MQPGIFTSQYIVQFTYHMTGMVNKEKNTTVISRNESLQADRHHVQGGKLDCGELCIISALTD